MNVFPVPPSVKRRGGPPHACVLPPFWAVESRTTFRLRALAIGAHTRTLPCARLGPLILDQVRRAAGRLSWHRVLAAAAPLKSPVLPDPASAALPDSHGAAAAAPEATNEGDLPGDLAIWIFIFAELLAFGVFFVSYAFTRAKNVALFNEMQLTLDREAGALNTVVLLLASYFVARAVNAIKRDRSQTSARWLAAGIACGAGFLVVKLFEYHTKFSIGINLSTNTFYMFYISLTFFHFMHVILGMVILAAVLLKTRRGGYSAADHHGMDTGASYWHMVDLVWLILFPLVYVMR